MIIHKGTAAVILATSISIPFISAKLTPEEETAAESAAAAAFSEVRAKPSIQEEIPILKSNVQIVDKYATGPPPQDDYPRMRGAYYAK